MFKVHITITCEREKKSENKKKITHLEFLKADDLFVSDEDGTKPCFLFSSYNGANFFSEELKNVFNLDATIYNYFGFHTVYVPISIYQDALRLGFHILLTDEKYEQAGAYWMNYYGSRIDSCGYEPILMLESKPDDLEESGHWKPYVKNKIEKWNKKLENVLDQEVCFRDEFGKAHFFIKRTSTSFVSHDNVLEKIRNADIFYRCPFSKYALLEYDGKYVK